MVLEMIHQLVEYAFLTYTLMLLVRIFGNWFPEWHHTRFMLFIAHYTDPYLSLFRRFIPPLGMLDLSPLVAFIALQILEWIVLTLIP